MFFFSFFHVTRAQTIANENSRGFDQRWKDVLFNLTKKYVLSDLKIMLTFSHRRKKLGKLVSHNFANDTLVDWAGCKVHNVEQ